MKTFLRSASVKGIKNIDKELTINFTKQGEMTKKELNDYNVKAIYGSNGSGKTAFLHGFKILSDLTVDKNYLSKPENTKFLFEIINKNCDSIKAKVEFFDVEEIETLNEYYTHEIELKKSDIDFIISYEKYSKTVISTKNETIIYESVKGVETQSKFSKEAKKFTMNLLDKRSFLNILADKFKNDDTQITKGSKLSYLKTLLKLYVNLEVIMDPNDTDKMSGLTMEEGLASITEKNKFKDDKLGILSKVKLNEQIVNDDEYSKMKQELSKQELFIRLFKPEIEGIRLNKRTLLIGENVNLHLVEYYIKYSKYEVNLQYESTGIRKLFKLYNSIKELSNGGVLIVDELDVHVNDVYLSKLIEYITKYAKGQLIFTSHNITPMDYLKDKKKAIDYITGDLNITSWIQRGNYSPGNLYQKGMIKGLPFNVEAEDFLTVFDNYE